MQPRQRNRVAPVCLDPLARPFRDQSWSDHQAVVAEGLHLAIKIVSRRPGFKADMQPILSACQSLDRPLDRQRTVLDSAEKPDLSRPPPSAIATACSSWQVESDKSFALLSHGPPSVHEALLGMTEQPRTKGRATGSARRTCRLEAVRHRHGFGDGEFDVMRSGGGAGVLACVALVDECDLDACPGRRLDILAMRPTAARSSALAGRDMRGQQVSERVDGRMQLRPFLTQGKGKICRSNLRNSNFGATIGTISLAWPFRC
jgi:hypothetical protein